MQDWLDRDQPDVVCLQEIKAAIDQLPLWLCELDGYWCYWHGGKGYSGVALHVSKRMVPERPTFAHPAFDYENRIVAGAAAGRDGRVGVRAERREGLPGQDAVPRGARAVRRGSAERAAPIVICGDLNIARTDMDVHPKERKPRSIGQLPEERAQLERIIGHGLVDVGRALEPDNDQMFTWWAPWRNMRQRNIGWRLDYVLASQALFDRVSRLHGAEGDGDERPRASGGGVRRLVPERLCIGPCRAGLRPGLKTRPYNPVCRPGSSDPGDALACSERPALHQHK